MKSRLILFYEMFLNTYYYNQRKDEETSREYAYTAIRNILGVIIFMSSVVILSVVTCLFELRIRLLTGPMFFVITGIFLYIYLMLTTKFFKPLFNNIKLKKEKPPKNYFFVITVILLALFCGGMYILGRLLTIYLCG